MSRPLDTASVSEQSDLADDAEDRLQDRASAFLRASKAPSTLWLTESEPS